MKKIITISLGVATGLLIGKVLIDIFTVEPSLIYKKYHDGEDYR